MEINGGCYCGAISFSAVSYTPYPFMRCYCSFCRKTSGSGGYGINIMAQADTLSINGGKHLHFHFSKEHDPKTDELIENKNRCYFCRHCGSSLWTADPRWPDSIYPYASAVNTPLPRPPEIVHIMLDFAASWVEIPSGVGHVHFKRYPQESILAWHKRHGLYNT